jgi:DNA replication licensing factor MCM2
VGLTAAVRKDRVTREWTLEGGALVLADNGVCLIDEFDKMNDKDRTSIHEAMEQQTISISKAGIVTTLMARCAVIAAANPIKGRYDASLPLSQNVQLGDPILSRFDVMAVLRDVVNPVQDQKLAEFVVQSHLRSHPSFKKKQEEAPRVMEGLTQDMLKKYIVYARQKCNPKLGDFFDRNKLSSLYAEVRSQSGIGGGNKMTVRYVESTVRLAEAHAKMHLREYVTEDDVSVAIRVALETFIAAQKQAVSKSMRNRFHKYLAYRRDNNELLFYLLQSLVRDMLTFHQSRYGYEPSTVSIPEDDFKARVRLG